MKRSCLKVYALFTGLLCKEWLIMYVAVFAVTFWRGGIFPDWCKLSSVASKKDLEFRLLTGITGFAGLLLSILVVAYNFYIRSIRRNTLDFIIENPWLRTSFSIFFCNTCFLCAGYMLLDTGIINDITYLYVSFTGTFCFVLFLFPLAILTLGDSASLPRIDQLVARISGDDLEALVQPELEPDKDGKITIEHMPFMLLRDITVGAVAEHDWALPQTVLRKLATHLVFQIDTGSDADKVYKILNAWTAFCNPLKREIIRQEDELTAYVLFNLNVAVYKHMAAKKLVFLREMPLDTFFKDFMYRMIKKGIFIDMQSYFPVNLTEIIRLHFAALAYSDQQMPTMGYIFENREEYEANAGTSEIRSHWFYLTRDLPDLLFSPMNAFIDVGDERMVGLCFSNFHHLCESIVKMDTLTLHQKVEAVQQMFLRIRRVTEYCITKGMTDGIAPVEQVYISGWFKIDSNLGYEGFYSYAEIIRTLHRANLLSSHYVDEYFMIARDSFIKNLHPEIIYQVVSSLLDTSFYILDKPETSSQTRKDFLYEIAWLKKEYLSKYPASDKINEEYGAQMDTYLATFDGRNEYFQGYHQPKKQSQNNAGNSTP